MFSISLEILQIYALAIFNNMDQKLFTRCKPKLITWSHIQCPFTFKIPSFMPLPVTKFGVKMGTGDYVCQSCSYIINTIARYADSGMNYLFIIKRSKTPKSPGRKRPVTFSHSGSYFPLNNLAFTITH